MTKVSGTLEKTAAESCPLPTDTDKDSRYVDLHADTAMHGLPLNSQDADPNVWMKIWMGITGGVSNDFTRQITCECLEKRQSGAQVFSITTEGFPPFYRASHAFYSDVVAGRPEIAARTGWNALLDQLAWIHNEVAKNPDLLAFATADKSCGQVMDHGQIAAWVGLEGAAALEVNPQDGAAYSEFAKLMAAELPPEMPLPTPEEISSTAGRVAFLARSGFLYVGLNHLDSTAFAGSDFILARQRGTGLSDTGRELVRELQQNGILIDAAHASQKTQSDLIGLSELPLVVSHGLIVTDEKNANAWRATAPELLQEIKRTGGLFGVMFANAYLENGTPADIVDQIDFVRDAIGIDYVAFGSDADGFVGMAVTEMDVNPILDEMRRRGYSEDDLAKLRYGNFLRMLAVRESIMAKRP